MFAVAPQPVYEYAVITEQKQGNIYLYGAQNEYPYLLLDLYKKSAKHAAIINAKAQYIYGGGWTWQTGATLYERAKAEQFFLNASAPDDINELTEKIILDNEIYNGFAIAVTWNRAGKIAHMEHVPFERVRVSVDGEFYYVADWYNDKMIRATNVAGAIEKMPAFNTKKRRGKQLYYHKNYSPGTKIYPLPNYMAAIPYIECDAEIAKFHINNIRNQFWGGMMINFNDGIPTEEEKEEIERQLKNKFSGAQNAGRFVLSFSNSKENAPTISALTPSDLDKQFETLNEQIQQEIFVAHNVVSPSIFGVRTEGALGNRTEMLDAYELFKNTYIANRVQLIEICFNYLASFNDVGKIHLEAFAPIAQQITETTLLQISTPDEMRERAGLPPLTTSETTSTTDVTNAVNTLSPLVATKVLEAMTPDEIRALAALPPKDNGDALPNETTITAGVINDAITGLSGRQYQNLMRIVRHYAQGKINAAQARTIIRAGYGMNDEEINAILGIDEQTFSAVDDEDNGELLATAGMAFGVDAEEFEAIHERAFTGNFSALTDADDVEYRREYYAAQTTPQDAKLDEKILAYRRENETATARDMARELDVSLKKIRERIQYLIDKGEYPIKRTAAGEKVDKRARPTDEEREMVFVMYRYDWRSEYRNLSREDGYERSRRFCQIMMDLSETKLYTRDDINAISAIVGYSVWERRGGWLTLPDGQHRPSCRHQWTQVLVIKRDGVIKRVSSFTKDAGKYAETYADYGDGVRNNARRGIELNERNGNKCATQTGKIRARQLAAGEGVSVETIKRMYSYLSRAETYYDNADSTTDCGYISYLLWGGKAALAWARNKLRELGELNEN